MQRETHPWIKSNEISSFGFGCLLIPHGGGRMRGSGPSACLPRRTCPSLGWCLSEATALPALSHVDLCHLWWAEQYLCPVTAHVPRSEVRPCLVACLHLAASPKEQTGSGFWFFTPLGNHRSLLPSATGAHSSDRVWVAHFDYDTCWHQSERRTTLGTAEAVGRIPWI